MNFEILVEDKSGRIALESNVERILGPNGQDHRYRFFHFKGLGYLPKDLHEKANPRKRQLLNLLPSYLRGYGKSLQGYCAMKS